MSVTKTLLSYTVPRGRVLIVTSYEIIITGSSNTSTPTALIPVTPFYVTLAVDGSSEPWNQAVYTKAGGGLSPCHLIVGGGQTFTIVGVFSYTGASHGYVFGEADFHGDMMIENDNPPQYNVYQPKVGQ